jgi:hypothetical protein
MPLDHLFLFTAPDALPERAALAALGLRETYHRAHPGQGTANVCFAFDDAYLELLWLTDEAEARSDAVRRTRLADRAAWRTAGTCPFGFAWRGPADVETWPYQPPYLPFPIPVAVASDDPRQPMWFQSPGTTTPLDWPAERRGRLQHDAGFLTLGRPTLHHPPDHPPTAAFVGRLIDAAPSPDGWAMTLRLTRADGGAVTLRLPDLAVT